MIIPSVDIMGGNAVQLIGGKTLEIDAGDPLAKLKEFRIAGEVAVIDLDAAMSQGSNAAVIEKMLQDGNCRVGGGIRDVETAISWLDRGASKIILGTKAIPEILRELPKERVQAALDANNGEVVIEGWKEGTGRGIVERMLELRDYVGGFLVTFVEKEGRMQGTNLDIVAELIQAAGDCSLTIAGGVTTIEDLKTLDRMGVDAQVGMALYSGTLHLADSISGILEDKISNAWPTLICDKNGRANSLVWSNEETLRESAESLHPTYLLDPSSNKSVSTPSNLLAITPDRERKSLQMTVDGLGLETSWGELEGLERLQELLRERKVAAPEGSYSKRLFTEPELLSGKILEEAAELVEATTADEISWEAADLFYFTMCKLVQSERGIEDVERELKRRSRKVSRRPGNLKK